MVIIIYKDGNHITKPDLESAFSLPGNYYVFSKENSFNLNHIDGVSFYNNNLPDKFRIGHLELVDIKKIGDANFEFSIYDYKTDRIKMIAIRLYFPHALSSIVKTIISASEFPNWDSYDSSIKIEEFKSEIKRLNEKVLELTKQNEELTNKIITSQKPI